VRTTIEIPDEQRAKLLEAAAKRGEKGFSSIVQEALADYFDAEERRQEKVRRALEVIGSLDADQTADLERSVRKLRQRWR
jgi:predicted transcriptional regulator